MAATESDTATSDSSLSVVDVSGQSLTHVTQISGSGSGKSVAALIADGNHFSTLRGINRYPSLIQLSVRSNNLVKMESVSPLLHLVTLNLQSNSITDIAGLERLDNLQWLCLAGNSISEMSGLASNKLLSHLDLSDNCICELGDVSMLAQLKTLLLHGNGVSIVQSVPHFLPPSLNTLSLAENDVSDLNQLSYLSILSSLTQLSVMGNPCLALSDSHRLFDYRTFILYWCPGVSTLDGIAVTLEERQRSLTLFPAGQPYPFFLGQHEALVSYLTSRSPLVSEQTIVQQIIAMQEQLSQQPEGERGEEEEGGGDSPGASGVPPSRELGGRYSPATKQNTVAVTRESKETGSRVRVSQGDNRREQGTAHSNIVAPSRSTTDPTQSYSGASPLVSEWTQPLDPEHSLLSELGSVHGRRHGTVPPDTSTAGGELACLESFARVSRPEGIFAATTATQTGADDRTSHHFSASSQQSPWSRGSEVLRPADMESDRLSSKSGKLDPLYNTEEAVTVPSEVSSGRSSPSVLELLPSETTVSPLASALTDGGGGRATEQEWSLDSSSLLEPSRTRKTVDAYRELTSSLAEQRQKQLRLLNEKIARLKLQQQQQQWLWPAPSLPPAHSVSSSHTTTTPSVAPPHTGRDAAHTMTSSKMTDTFPTGVADISQQVTPADYRLPGVPSYVTASPATTDAEKMSSTGVTILPQSPPGSRVTSELSGEASHMTSELPRGGSHMTSELSRGGSHMTSESDLLQGSSHVIFERMSEDSHVTSELPRTGSHVTSEFVEGGGHVTSELAREGSHVTSCVYSHTSSLYEHLDPVTRTSTLEDISDFPQELDPDPDLLDSSSRYLPVSSPVPAPGHELDSTTTHSTTQEPSPVPRSDDGTGTSLGLSTTEQDVSTLATSLIQAYGLTASTGPTTQLFPSLISTRGGSSGIEDADQLEPVISDSLSEPSVGSVSTYTRPSMKPELSEHLAAMRIQAAVRGCLVRKHLKAYVQQHWAATVIQAVWRGYRARCCDPVVVGVRGELRSKKLEALVTVLYLRLLGCSQEVSHQAHVLQIQDETIQSLALEVDILNHWRAQDELKKRNRAATVIQRNWRCYVARKRRGYSGYRLKSSRSGLWRMCYSLKEQVQQLEAMLVSMLESTYVYGETRQRYQRMGFIGATDSSMSEKPSDGESSSLQGDFPPPTALQMSHHSDSCLLLQWTPPTTPHVALPTTAATAAPSPRLLGFRVYVNGSPRGTVGAAKSKAYLEGLEPSTTYRIAVRAVYAAGESRDSNPVMASLTLPPQQRKDGDKSSADSQSAVTSLADSSSTTPRQPRTLEAVGRSGTGLGSGETKLKGTGALDKLAAASTNRSPAALQDAGLNSSELVSQLPNATAERSPVLDTPDVHPPPQEQPHKSLSQLPVGEKSNQPDNTSSQINTKAGADDTPEASLESNPRADESSKSDDNSKDGLEKSETSDTKKENDEREDGDCETEGLGNRVLAVGSILEPSLDANVTQGGIRTDERTLLTLPSPNHVGVTAGTAVEIPEEPTGLDVTTLTEAVKTDSAPRDDEARFLESAEAIAPALASGGKPTVAFRAKAATTTTSSITSSSAATTTTTAKAAAGEKLGSIEDVFLPGREMSIRVGGDDQSPSDFDPLPGNSRTEAERMGSQGVGSNPTKRGGGHPARSDDSTTTEVFELPEGKQSQRIVVGNKTKLDAAECEPQPRGSGVGSDFPSLSSPVST